jgi:hypothetical protein
MLVRLTRYMIMHCSPNSIRYAKYTNLFKFAESAKTLSKHKSKKDHARGWLQKFHLLCPMHIFFKSHSLWTYAQSSPIPACPIRRRHQPLPRSLGFLLQQVPLNIPAPQINIRYQSTPNDDRNTHQKQIDR